MRTAGIAALGAVLAGLAAPTGAAAAPSYIVGTNCHEQQGFVDGDAAAVAARLPQGYTPQLDAATGAPLVFARAMRCDGVRIGPPA